MEDYFKETKKRLEERIPDIESPDFKKMGEKIRKELQKKENEKTIILRRLKILILGDWYTEEKKGRLSAVKNTLLKSGLYAETIDGYYDTAKRSGLSPQQVLETCCIYHQLIVFIDGDGKGTITEQNYLAANYIFHGKIVFFIEESKFNRLKDNPNEYIKSFPTIVPYDGSTSDLEDKAVTYARLRMHRLAEIIQNQEKSGRGLKNPNYEPWKKRLKRR